jgi:hypothetical protein
MSDAVNSIRCGISALALAAGMGIGPSEAAAADEMSFTVTIEQLTTEQTLKLPDGSASIAPLSPGTAVVHSGPNPLFTVGEPASTGLQRQSEAGQPDDLLAAMKGAEGVSAVVMFDRTDTFTITAQPGEMLSFATMFGQSNDCFYAPKGDGIRLFDRDGRPIMGERSVEVVLYDAAPRSTRRQASARIRVRARTRTSGGRANSSTPPCSRCATLLPIRRSARSSGSR